MACYAAVSSLLRLLEDIVHHQRYPNILLSTQQTLKSLHQRFSFLEELLQDISSTDSEATDSMERLMRDAAYKAQDTIQFQISDLTASELEKVEQQVDSIMEDVAAIKEKHRTQHSGRRFHFANVSASRPSPIVRNIMVGFDKDRTVLKNHLCGGSPNLQVISIVGDGGIGKTTLAYNIFDDPTIVNHFDRRSWVTVSRDYNMRSILVKILNYYRVGADMLSQQSNEFLAKKVCEQFNEKIYLIVIDGVWSTKVWDDLVQILPDCCNGSRILLTTRLPDVARNVSSASFIHQMQYLDKNESWDLLKSKVFSLESCPPELEVIGKCIAENCGGLPLAIVAIAGILSNLRKPYFWDEILKDLSSILDKDGERLSKILCLTYNLLPPQLKACLLYMARFREDYEISISKLTRLWVGEGFLKPSTGFKSLEKVARECLEELVKRDLVRVTKRRTNDQLKLCSLHGLIRDFCKQRAHHENFFLDSKSGYLDNEGIENVRRINLEFFPSDVLEAYDIGVLTRSIICSYNMDQLVDLTKWSDCKLLMVLDLMETKLWPIPNSIFWLFHLKYLSFRVDIDEVICLPPSLSKLQNLQTLAIRTPHNSSISLPSTIWEMAQLRHLIIITGTMLLPYAHFKKLEYLQTLEVLQNFMFTYEAVVMIPNIKRLKLKYEKLGHDDNLEFYCFNNLVHLSRLEELSIAISNIVIPGILVLPLTLKKLSLCGGKLPWSDVKVVGCLPKLGVLKLRLDACVGEEWDSTEGTFPALKFLLFDSLDLMHWHVSDIDFPCLEHLLIRRCMNLKEIPHGIGHISSLTLIEVNGSPQLGESALQILEEQRNRGNNALQVLVDRWKWRCRSFDE